MIGEYIGQFMKNINVLVFPAGAENALEIYESLRYNLNITVFGASGKSDHASFVYPKDRYFEGDYYITRDDFIERFNVLLETYNIDVVIPTHDTVSLYFAEHREEFRSKILTSDLYTARICRSKRLTFQLFQNYEFCPIVYNSVRDVPKDRFPVFIKPDIGEGAKGTSIAKDVMEAEAALSKDPTALICELLPGDEFTVDCFAKADGSLMFAGCRTRERIWSGIAARSRSIPMTDEVKNIAMAINEKLHFFGAWFFQLKLDFAGRLKLLEVSCRQAGTMTLYRHKGINFALLGVYELMGVDTSVVEIPCSIILDRCLHASFQIDYDYNTVYLDYDDTLVCSGKVNTIVLAFIYQCHNEGKRVILLTKHEGDMDKTLEDHKLFPGMFDEIIHITFDEEKTQYIKPDHAIVIDNSFSERKKIFEAFNIPVFDVDAVDCLLR